VVVASFGRILGHEAITADMDSCEEFLGIPFAERPQRFEQATAWRASYGQSGLVARQYGPWCPQMDGSAATGSEDCLFLNIWRPKGSKPGDNLTAMVWIHGGGYVTGDAGDRSTPNTYDGCGLAARHNVIVAAMNYRLGPLGFAAFARSDGGIDANIGIEDQREALRWFQREALGFGADPAKVTIFGESAGGMSVFHHIASPRSVGLFRAAISESGLPFAFGREYGLNSTVVFAKRVGCEDATTLRSCLRSRPFAQLVQAASRGSPFSYGPAWGPTVDGDDLLDHPRDLLFRNLTAAVPLLAGGNTDDSNVVLWPEYPDGMNSSQYSSFLTRVLTSYDPKTALSPAQLEEVFHRYPAAPSGDQRPLAARAFTDFGILCGTWTALASLSARANAFFYRFDHRTTCPRAGSVPGVYHALELPYVFGTPRSYECSFTAAEKALSSRMQGIWTNFAKYLTPSPFDGSYPAFRSSSPKGVVLRTPADVIEDGYRASYCRFWSSTWHSKHRSAALAFI